MRTGFHKCRVLVLVVGIALLVGSSTLLHAQTDERCFQETNQCISGRIREYWETQGGLPVFGLPIGPQYEEEIEGQMYQVQWFERARLELHPENTAPYDVVLGRLGATLLEQQGGAEAPAEPQEGCQFFAETGHNVCGDILATWQAYGVEIDGQPGSSYEESLALFGLPLTEARTETLSDGQEYVVQWFERARFEEHPENTPPYHVLQGLLGREAHEGGAGSSGGDAEGPAEGSCDALPPSVNGTADPACVRSGETLMIDVHGFAPAVEVSIWVHKPDGALLLATEGVLSNPQGDLQQIPLDTSGLPVGLWMMVIESTDGMQQAIVYFVVLPPGS